MNFYEEHPFWVRKNDPAYVVRVRVYDTTTLMWNPKNAWTVTVQRLDGPEFAVETYKEPEFRKLFEEFIPPRPTVKPSSEAWWREKDGARDFVQVYEVEPWQRPTFPVSVFFGKGRMLSEAEFLEKFEPSGPPPDKKTVWGKVWDDD